MFSPEDFEIIDMHVHPFEDVAQRIGGYRAPADAESFHAELLRLGIDRYAGSVLQVGPAGFEWIRHLNRIALRLRDRFPAYIPGIHVHGDFVEESCAELHAMCAEGVRLVGELVPYMLHTGAFDSPGMLAIFREAAKLGMVVNLHHVERHEAEALAREVPELKVIFAHPGEFYGEWNAHDRMKFIGEHENMYMDISASGLLRWNFLRWFIDLYGVGKLLFGSDMPTCSAGMTLYGVLVEHLSKAELESIFSGNFKRLIGE